MAKYNVRILPSAQNDLVGVIDYLNTLSPDAAVRYYDAISGEIESLSEMPERCPLVRDAHLRLRGYHTLLVKSYYVFYKIRGTTVEIHRVLYNKRQYESLL